MTTKAATQESLASCIRIRIVIRTVGPINGSEGSGIFLTGMGDSACASATAPSPARRAKAQLHRRVQTMPINPLMQRRAFVEQRQVTHQATSQCQYRNDRYVQGPGLCDFAIANVALARLCRGLWLLAVAC